MPPEIAARMQKWPGTSADALMDACHLGEPLCTGRDERALVESGMKLGLFDLVHDDEPARKRGGELLRAEGGAGTASVSGPGFAPASPLRASVSCFA